MRSDQGSRRGMSGGFMEGLEGRQLLSAAAPTLSEIVVHPAVKPEATFTVVKLNSKALFLVQTMIITVTVTAPNGKVPTGEIKLLDDGISTQFKGIVKSNGKVR